MRKRTKAIITIIASTLCVLAFAGVAYGAALSGTGPEAPMDIDDDSEPMAVEKGSADMDSSHLQAVEAEGGEGNDDKIADASDSEQATANASAASAPSVPAIPVEATVEPTTTEPLAETSCVDESAMGLQAPEPRTISMLGTTIPYVDSFNTASAPMETAGLWAGDESTTDGSWAYFIGHHPGVFNCVMDLQNGDAVEVCDNCGNVRTYHVISIYDIPTYTSYEELAADVESHGESITLQTCYGDNEHYRIVEAV